MQHSFELVELLLLIAFSQVYSEIEQKLEELLQSQTQAVRPTQVLEF